MVWKIGVEGHGVTGLELRALAVADEDDGAGLDQRGLAAAGLVHRRVAGSAGDRARGQRVARQLRSLTGQRRRQDLVAVPAYAAGALSPLVATHDRPRTVLVEAQQLRQPELQAGGDSPGHLQR